jgi:hypothetical protein
VAGKSLRLIGIVAVVVALALAPSTASAEQVTLGPDLSGPLILPGLVPGCPPPACTMFQDVIGGGPAPSSPVNGVITSWTLRALDTFDNNGAQLRVLRVNGSGVGTTFSVLRSSAPAGLVTANTTAKLSTSLPIAVGDRIGLHQPTGQPFPVFVGTPDDRVLIALPPDDPADGGSGTANSNSAGQNIFLAVNATISFCRVPAVKKKKFKRAKALLAAEGCLVKKSGHGKKVKRQSLAPGTTVAPGTVVRLKLKKS